LNDIPLSATGCPSSNLIEMASGLIETLSRQNAAPMIGSTIVIPLFRNSRSLASWVAPSRLESVEYAFSALMWYESPARTMYSDISLRPPSSSMNC